MTVVSVQVVVISAPVCVVPGRLGPTRPVHGGTWNLSRVAFTPEEYAARLLALRTARRLRSSRARRGL